MNPLYEIKHYGRELSLRGLADSPSCAISIRTPDKIFITKAGTFLGDVTQRQIASALIFDSASLIDQHAAIELPIHHAIYKHSGTQAIVRTFPHHLIALSLSTKTKTIFPIDDETLRHLPKINVIEGSHAYDPDHLAAAIAGDIGTADALIVRALGLFTCGDTLADAYRKAICAEAAAKIIYLAKTYRGA